MSFIYYLAICMHLKDRQKFNYSSCKICFNFVKLKKYTGHQSNWQARWSLKGHWNKRTHMLLTITFFFFFLLSSYLLYTCPLIWWKAFATKDGCFTENVLFKFQNDFHVITFFHLHRMHPKACMWCCVYQWSVYRPVDIQRRWIRHTVVKTVFYGGQFCQVCSVCLSWFSETHDGLFGLLANILNCTDSRKCPCIWSEITETSHKWMITLCSYYMRIIWLS